MEMKRYSASTIDRDGKILILKEKEYKNLADFRSDIHANGLRIYRNHIAEGKRFDWILENTNADFWHWKQKTGIETLA
jgi:hypothetical protein